VDGKEGPPDVCVIELGGTIGTVCWIILHFLTIFQKSEFYYSIFCTGDIESMPFIEALGQFSYKVGERCSNLY